MAQNVYAILMELNIRSYKIITKDGRTSPALTQS